MATATKIQVENRPITSGRTCSGGLTWKEHWQAHMENIPWPKLCVVDECYEDAEHGAHVFKTSDTSKTYIVPFCRSHNNRYNDDKKMVSGFWLVSATDHSPCKSK